MKIYKFIETVKAKAVSGNLPTHYLKAKENQTDKDGELVASLWAKTWENPETKVKSNWLSGQMKNEYKDHTDPSKSREGFVVVKEKELKELIAENKSLKGEASDDEIPTPSTSDIPF